MAIGPKVTVTWITPTLVDATSQDAVRLATNVTLVTKPSRPWRSATAGSTHTERIRFNLGSAVNPAIIIVGCNVTPLRFEYGSNGTTWTDLGTQTINLDRRCNRRKKWYEPGVSAQWWRISAENLAASAYVELGTVVFTTSVRTWADPMGAPLQWQILQAATKLPYTGGGGEVNVDGRPYLRGALQNPQFLLKQTQLDDVFTALGAGKGAPIIAYDNLGDDSQLMIGQREDDGLYDRDFVTFGSSIQIEEYV